VVSVLVGICDNGSGSGGDCSCKCSICQAGDHCKVSLIGVLLCYQTNVLFTCMKFGVLIT
jgi:hypothetical protein